MWVPSIQIQFNKIITIQKLIATYFNNNFLISLKNESYVGYEFPKTKNFLYSKRKRINFKPIDFINIRFLCGLKLESKTRDLNLFYKKIDDDLSSPLFLMLPYFYKKIEDNGEYLRAYSTEFECCLKLNTKTGEILVFYRNYKKSDKKTNILKAQIKEVLKFDVCGMDPVVEPRDDRRKLQDDRRKLQDDRRKLRDDRRNPQDERRKLRIDNQLWDNDLKPENSENHIISAINNTIKHMRKGECYLANITHRYNFKEEYNFFSAENFLQKWFLQKPQFGFWISQLDVKLASFSPERFIVKKGAKIITEPIKGTQKSLTPSLWKNKKEMHEHTMVVDLLRHDLNTICIPGSVIVRNPFFIKKCSHILQMQSSILGTLPKNISILQILNAMLPVGSITGTPKKSVCNIIENYEEKKRGYYTGVAGIIEQNKDFDFAVLIRSVFQGTYGTYTGVGAGITTLSIAENEFNEFLLKLKSFL